MQAFPSGALAFYNSGKVSGASQPHKHVQIVPLPLGDSDSHRLPFAGVLQQAWQEAGQPSSSDAPLALRQLPFQAWCCALPEG